MCRVRVRRDHSNVATPGPDAGEIDPATGNVDTSNSLVVDPQLTVTAPPQTDPADGTVTLTVDGQTIGGVTVSGTIVMTTPAEITTSTEEPANLPATGSTITIQGCNQLPTSLPAQGVTQQTPPGPGLLENPDPVRERPDPRRLKRCSRPNGGTVRPRLR